MSLNLPGHTLRACVLFASAMFLAVRPTLADSIDVNANRYPATSAWSITSGYSVSYSPSDAINYNGAQGNGPWGSSGPTDFGGTGYNVVGSHFGDVMPELGITVSGLQSKPYEVLARVFTNSNDLPSAGQFIGYGSRLGFDPNNLVTYSHNAGGTLLATGDYADGPGTYEIRQFLLGTETPASGSLTVYLGDFNAMGLHVTSNLSGLTLIAVPEPSPLVLAAIGLVGVLAVRSRFRRR